MLMFIGYNVWGEREFFMFLYGDVDLGFCFNKKIWLIGQFLVMCYGMMYCYFFYKIIEIFRVSQFLQVVNYI